MKIFDLEIVGLVDVEALEIVGRSVEPLVIVVVGLVRKQSDVEQVEIVELVEFQEDHVLELKVLSDMTIIVLLHLGLGLHQ